MMQNIEGAKKIGGGGGALEGCCMSLDSILVAVGRVR